MTKKNNNKNTKTTAKTNLLLSHKQFGAALWWNGIFGESYDGIICDGAVRSGKSFALSIGFVLWAMASHPEGSFAICGKTIKSVRRNVADPLIAFYRKNGFTITEKRGENCFDVKYHFGTVRFYLFGGRDAQSASLIQGMTLCGVLFDEVCLMPQSFVEQAVARCSEPEAKLWFSCNPENPSHWFYREWIKKTEEKNILYLHFTMEDNPSLSQKVRERYKRLYSGEFYKRYVLGQWTNIRGAVYPMFSEKDHVTEVLPEKFEKYVVSVDYGTVNPCSAGLWGRAEGRWYRIREYYYDSKREGQSRTDEEHYAALEDLCGGIRPDFVIVDPSAASFMEVIRRHGRYTCLPAKNDVLSGIRRVSDMLRQGELVISAECRDIIREFYLYCWKEDSLTDCPVKENDHAMDDMRYFVNTYIPRDKAENSFFAASLARG